MKFAAIFCLIIFCFFGVSAQERYVKPVDEAAQDASFLAFRAKLISAVKNRDTKYLLSILDRNVKASFGGDDGIADFKKYWKLNRADSEIWETLLKVLTNGGTFHKDGNLKYFSAPFVFTEFPEDLDAFEYQVIFGKNVNLREKPDAKSAVAALLSYNIVKVDYQNSVSERGKKEGEFIWLKIETLGGKSGFVQAKYVRSPIDYRAVFEKKGKNWKLVALVSGD